MSNPPAPFGRGSHLHPPNRFTLIQYEDDFEHLQHDPEAVSELKKPKTEYFTDRARSIVSENDSPDIPFRYSVNPYRGCLHGCAYCYARPYHEYLGLNAGLDFETKIFVKEDAPSLFRDFLARETWRPEPIILSGVTDCYQPAERDFRLTRGCLEVAVEVRQPLGLITKNALILRDLDLLRDLAADNLVHVTLSITSLDAALARVLEPRTSTPTARLHAVTALAEAGVPVRVFVAPVIPGLTDSEMPAILAAAKAAGARGGLHAVASAVDGSSGVPRMAGASDPTCWTRSKVAFGRRTAAILPIRGSERGWAARARWCVRSANCFDCSREARPGRRPARLRLYSLSATAIQFRPAVVVLMQVSTS